MTGLAAKQGRPHQATATAWSACVNKAQTKLFVYKNSLVSMPTYVFTNTYGGWRRDGDRSVYKTKEAALASVGAT